MNTLTDLREYLISRVPELKRGPDRLLTFVEDGQIIFHAGENYSHQYKMPVRLIVTDWRLSADLIVIPVLEWLHVREPGFDPETVIKFEAEILDKETVDLALTINITERVIVKDENNTRTVTHVLPPPPMAMEQNASLQIIVDGPLGNFVVPEES